MRYFLSLLIASMLVQIILDKVGIELFSALWWLFALLTSALWALLPWERK